MFKVEIADNVVFIETDMEVIIERPNTPEEEDKIREEIYKNRHIELTEKEFNEMKTVLEDLF